MYRTCLIQLATDIPTSKLSNYNTRGERERERKSRLRLAFCPGSLPAIRRVNAALNARWLHSYTYTPPTMRDHRAEQRAIVIDLRRPDHRAGRKRTARRENPLLLLLPPLPGSMSATLRTSIFHPFSSTSTACIIMLRVKGDRH